MSQPPPDPFELEIDRFGRVLIPKRVREALNLRPGSRVQASVSEGGLRLTAQEPHYRVDWSEGGRPVVHLDGSVRLGHDPVKETGDERMDRLMKW